MKLKTKSTYWTKNANLEQMAKDVYDDLRMLEPTIVESLPDATKEYRGKIVVKQTTGTDEVYVCVYNGTGYEWKKLYLS